MGGEGPSAMALLGTSNHRPPQTDEINQVLVRRCKKCGKSSSTSANLEQRRRIG